MTPIKFKEYFDSFYGKDGIYPIKDTPVDVIEALITLRKYMHSDSEFVGDSFDRELIRDIIFTQEELNKVYS